MIKVYGYSRCSTVQKALKFLDNHNVKYEHIDNVENKLSQEQLKEIHNKAQVDIKKLFNTSGMKYRELGLKDKLADMSEKEKYKLLASDGMLVKRPLIITCDRVVIGFKEKELIEII